MRLAALALPALLAACDIGGDCLPAAVSPERNDFRQELRALTYVSQCHGPPVPEPLRKRSDALQAQQRALLYRIRNSKLAPDLAQAVRENEEWSRNVHEAECAMYPDDYGSRPEDLRDSAAGLDAQEGRIRTVAVKFERLNAPCLGS